jgi:hypothetical protein
MKYKTIYCQTQINNVFSNSKHNIMNAPFRYGDKKRQLQKSQMHYLPNSSNVSKDDNF